MKIRLEATPSNLPIRVLNDILKVDRICFEADKPVETENSWFWVVRNDQGKAIGYGGMRPCIMSCHRNMAFMTRSGVIPAYRGLGIQKRLIKARVQKARRLGYTSILTYVLDWNVASTNSLIACGFKLYVPKVKYVGDRVIYLRKVL